MKLNFKTILQDSNHIYELLSNNIRYLFRELQELTNFDDTKLCLAICQLLQDGRMHSMQVNNQIYYYKKE
ncbi:MAG: hypothetical protein IKK07_03860 [Bacteroides sp.]|nr:hypothetical protein [Bacteroides sp.]